jgi:hypothetical protein
MPHKVRVLGHIADEWCSTFLTVSTCMLKAVLSVSGKGLMHAGGLRPYGVDPSFNARSRLYRSGSFQQRWQFFNASKSSPELSSAGAPFAFFPRNASGYNDGFPVFFPVRVQPPSVPVSHFLLALQGTFPTEMFGFLVHTWHCAGHYGTHVCRCKSQE